MAGSPRRLSKAAARGADGARPRGVSPGSRLVVALLVLTMTLTAVLAFLAQDAVRAHKKTARRILGDYAALAANSYARRIAAELDGYAFEPALQALQTFATPGGEETLPPPAPVKVWIGPRNEILIDLVKTNFALPLDAGALVTRRDSLDAGALVTRGDSLVPDARAWLADTVRAHARGVYGKDWSSAALIGAGEGARAGAPERVIVYTVRRDSAGAPVLALGFEAKPAGLDAYFEYALKVRPLIPPPLTSGIARDSLVSVIVTSPAGRVLYRSPWQNEASISATDTLGARFGNISVGATLRSDAGDVIVPSGPPRAHVPLLAGLSLVAMALMSAAILQIRREQELARLRSDFVASVSHELRTPLAEIRLFAETLLLGRVRSEEEGRRSLEIIGQEAMRLAHLVDNVLHVARSDRRALRLSPEPTDLPAIVREVVDAISPLAAGRNARLRVEAAGPVLAAVDPAAMRQILINLVDNAVKHGPAGQTIDVAVFVEDSRAVLRVDDQGPGIPPRDRERIWERFVRLPRDGEGAISGTGIGLSVVRELALLHGGASWVEESPARGARFIVSLPAADRAGGAAGSPP